MDAVKGGSGGEVRANMRHQAVTRRPGSVVPTSDLLSD